MNTPKRVLAVTSSAAVLPDGLDVRDLLTGPRQVRARHRVEDLDARTALGDRGLSALDRVSRLALVACTRAMSSAGGGRDRDRFAVVAATTCASLRSVVDYSAATLTEPLPYLVNPLVFANTVMNAAPGQVAIRLGLRGPNATLAGGPVAGLQALRYALVLANSHRLDHALVFGAEELSQEYEQLHRSSRSRAPRPGEGAAALVLDARAGGHTPALTKVVAGTIWAGGSEQRALSALVDHVDSGRHTAVLTTPVTAATRAWAGQHFTHVVDLLERLPFFGSASALLALVLADAAINSGHSPSVTLVGRGGQDQVLVGLVEGARP